MHTQKCTTLTNPRVGAPQSDALLRRRLVRRDHRGGHRFDAIGPAPGAGAHDTYARLAVWLLHARHRHGPLCVARQPPTFSRADNATLLTHVHVCALRRNCARRADTLFRTSPDLPAAEMREHMDGNLCRCTGYRPILDAAQSLCADGCSSGGCGASANGCGGGCASGGGCAHDANASCKSGEPASCKSGEPTGRLIDGDVVTDT
jgi:hypothetical protein